jgi:hypothetical protein
MFSKLNAACRFPKNIIIPTRRIPTKGPGMKFNWLELVLILFELNWLLKYPTMITIIKFQRISRNVTAKIVLTYKEDKKEVTVDFLGCTDDLGEKLLIVQIDGKWATDSLIARKFRATYLDILNEINWLCSHEYTKVKAVGEYSELAHLN